MVPKKHRAGEDGAITNPNQQKPVRHIGLKRKHQLEGPVPKSKENGAVTNSRIKCKNRKYSQGGALTNPSFTQTQEKIIRKAVRSPTCYTPKRVAKTLTQKPKPRGKVARNTHTKMGGELLYQPNPKGGEYGLLFFRFVKGAHSCYFCKMHTLISTNGAASNHELGRKQDANHPPTRSQHARENP